MNQTTLGTVIRHVLPTTSTPWQRGRYIDLPKFAAQPTDWKRQREAEERRLIRGPGIPGTESCEQIATVVSGRPGDLDLIVKAVNTRVPLLAGLIMARDALTQALADVPIHNVEARDRITQQLRDLDLIKNAVL